jgi:feruloyl esterase
MTPVDLHRRLPACVPGVACALALGFAVASGRADDCAGLLELKLPHARITSAVATEAQDGYPAYCAVTAHAYPTSDSDITIGIALPAAGWNGKYLQLGNGGFAGEVPDVRGGMAAGFVTAGTDDGHQDGNGTDASWALGHPQKVKDFGYRALKETTATAKAVTAALYGSGPRLAYFFGCSDGGREALMEAQRYPEEWNGIAVGAPANFFTHLATGFVYDQQQLAQAPIGLEKLPAIQAESLNECDAADGVVDGLNSDPEHCRLQPEHLFCRGQETDQCLTQPQIDALKKIMAGPRDPSDQSKIFPGYGMNASADPAIYPWLFSDGGTPTYQSLFGDQFYINMVFEDPDWDYMTLNRTSDVRFADHKLAGILNSTNPDLSALAQRGAKIIMYHGWEDPAISPTNSIHYFESVHATSIDGKKIPRSDYLRLFMAPGMGHCGSGPGPNSFDIFNPLFDWVENGVAPERIIATKFVNDDPNQGVEMTRPLCPYPQRALWNGQGSTDDASNFVCG